jgi:predicted nuclease of predicted toxin-antitoxin system
MSLSFLLDMNASAEWVPILNAAGYPAVRWPEIGSIEADDDVIMSWARDHKLVVFTNDLDFGQLLALTNASSPSVVLLRD